MQRRLLLTAFLGLAAFVARDTTAQAPATYIYAFSQTGKVSANAYELDNLPDNANGIDDEEWWDIFVRGEDRWLIRGDGKVALNGSVIQDLADDDNWRGIVVDDNDTFFALRSGGRISGPNGIVMNYDAGSYEFLDIETDGQAVYVLKTNGAVFRIGDTDPLIVFNGPPGEISGSSGDGQAQDTLWTRFLIHPVTGQMWALRRDGILKSADIPLTPPVSPDPGTLQASLPYNNGDDFIDPDDLYRDFTFDADGTWYAIRSDGRLFNTVAQGPPLVDLPGEPTDGDGQTYVSVLARDGQTVALRKDGKVYRDITTEAVTDLKDSDYFLLALGDTMPNLDNVKNQPPVCSSMTIVAPEGADVALPVIATDRDKESANLIVDIVAETLPLGASWDSVTRSILWPGASPVGSYKIKVTVNDGIAKPVTAVQTITIKPLDTNPEKNVKPFIAKLKKAVALVAIPFEMQVIAFDRDNDPLDLSMDTSGRPLPEGVAFDDQTGILTWDGPLIANKGSQPFKFLAEDGTATGKRTIKVKVDTSLLAF